MGTATSKGTENVAPVVSIDGPAGAGKSTVARSLARRLGYFLLDTGAIYRAVALVARRQQVAWSDGPNLAKVAETMQLHFTAAGDVLVGQQPNVEDVSQAIRTPELSQGASTVSAHPEVRDALLELQRRIARQGRCVVEGRDIGTVVLPWAPVKFFLTARPEVRAQRRYDELHARGVEVSLEETLAEILERDHRDTTRTAAPLKQADDAVLIDSSELSLDGVVEKLESLARQILP